MGDDRGLRNRKPLSNAIDKKLWYMLDELSKETRINKSKLLDEAVEDLLKKYGKSLNNEHDDE
ncbi:ribbon-helix-helix domain-containing protein [Thermoflavimicrobium dichotomicum]|uniref:Ribbon-helix-helix domain-containing protein n=1 Tax=Thermoflavimicrobium dichotomicum TaxID=46223 RepID=A0A1I3VA51_9BACL|nr:ribbon-helix-helix domain-containing protein [Thermoflavimicrobium dichotomicum]SFJ92268.1 Ribbon-helix-helix domain-containing protein [Thermoflavimicrobium dichotomicum]